HLHERIGVAQSFQESALRGLTGHDDRTRRPSFKQPLFGVEHEAALRRGHLRVMATETALGKNRPDFRFEKVRIGRLRGYWGDRPKPNDYGYTARTHQHVSSP